MKRTAVGVVFGGVVASALVFASGTLVRDSIRVDASAAQRGPIESLASLASAELIVDKFGEECGKRVYTWQRRYGAKTESVSVTREQECVKEVSQCSVRAIISPKFLTNLESPDSSLAALAKADLARRLSDFDEWPVGAFKRVKDMSLAWRRSKDNKPQLEVVADIGMSKADVRAKIVVTPTAKGKKVSIASDATIKLSFHSGVTQWFADLLRADRVASWVIDGELEETLERAWGPIPDIPIPGGGKLSFTLCENDAFTVGDQGEMVIGMSLDSDYRGPTLASGKNIPLTGLVALQVDAHGLNALLHELWQQGVLAREIEIWDAPTRFTEIDVVRDFLSVRIGEVKLVGAPALIFNQRGALEGLVPAQAILLDRDKRTNALINLRLALQDGAEDGLLKDARLTDASLSCVEGKSLVPCYGGIRAQAVAHFDEISQLIREQMNLWLETIARGQRLSASGWGQAHIDGVRLRFVESAPGGTVHVDIDTEITWD